METENTQSAKYSVLLAALFIMPLVSCGKAEAPGTPAETAAPAAVSAPVQAAEPAAASSVPAAASTVPDAASSVPSDKPAETK